ncbi:MAG TPA: FAD-dependent oxidoreductase [Thermoanaerobaculia bacterium]|jgi:monoamine oxidase|nr:FAD-dependent oxidoreductase [Thermoanaerobaculia bacterium]
MYKRTNSPTKGGRPAKAKTPEPDSNNLDIAIVGGGISGLFCLYKLLCAKRDDNYPAKLGDRIALFEASDRLGGRIYTQRIPKVESLKSERDREGDYVKIDSDMEFYSEFGPMRLETEFQPLLRKLLVKDLGFSEKKDEHRPYLQSFSDYRSPTDEHEPRYDLRAEEAEQGTPLDLLKLSFVRILGRLSVRWEEEKSFRWEEEKDAEEEKGQIEEAKKSLDKILSNGVSELSRQNSSRQADWKGTLQNWIDGLSEHHYQWIRRFAQFDGLPLHSLGFSNLVSEVLSYDAEVKLRDLGTFYHFLPENPNAAEWLIFWLRALKTTTLQGIYGGIETIIASMVMRMPSVPGAINLNSQLVSLEEIPGDPFPVKIILRNAKSKKIYVKRARRVILALPKGPLDQIMIRSEKFSIEEEEDGQAGTSAAKQHLYFENIRWHLDRVFPIPLLKVFVIVKNRWWEEDTANFYATRIPTRELHYFASSRPGSRKGAIMVYMDNPNLPFWSNYIRRQGEQHRPEWNEPNPEVELKGNERGFSWDSKPEWNGEPIDWSKYRNYDLCKSDRERNEERVRLMKKKIVERRLALKILQYLRQFRPTLKEDDIESCGIRDWGRAPYLGACHAWRPESESWETLSRLAAFHLDANGWEYKENKRTLSCRDGIIHVCGEAYSDYHGFIEGSLRSAAHVLHVVVRSADPGLSQTHFESPTPWLCKPMCDACKSIESLEASDKGSSQNNCTSPPEVSPEVGDSIKPGA